MDCKPARPLCYWESPGKNTRVVDISFSRGSSQPRDQSQVSWQIVHCGTMGKAFIFISINKYFKIFTKYQYLNRSHNQKPFELLNHLWGSSALWQPRGVWGVGWKGGSRGRRPQFDSWLRRFHGDRNGNPFQYSCLENAMDRGTWQATVHGVTKTPWVT